MFIYWYTQAEDREEEKATSPTAEAEEEDSSKVEATADSKKKAAEVSKEEDNGEASDDKEDAASGEDEKGKVKQGTYDETGSTLTLKWYNLFNAVGSGEQQQLKNYNFLNTYFMVISHDDSYSYLK